jgi:hypothetical protein
MGRSPLQEASLKIGRASHDTERRFGGRIGGRRPSMNLRKVAKYLDLFGRSGRI